MGMQGFFGGLGQGIAQVGAQMGQAAADTNRLRLSAEIDAKREARMAAIRKGEIKEERQYQDGVRQEGYVVDGIMAEREAERQAAAAAAASAESDREAARDHGYDLTLASVKKPDTVINTGDVSDKYQQEYDKGRATSDLETFTELRKQAQSAYAIEDSLSIVEKLNEQFDTGAMPQMAAELGRYLGTDQSKAMETFRGAVAPLVQAQMALATGPQTDADAVRFEQANAAFGTSNEANKVFIDLARKALRRTTSLYESMDAHDREFGSLRTFKMPSDIRLAGGASTPTQNNPSNGAADDPIGILD